MAAATGGNVESGNSPATKANLEGTNAPPVNCVMAASKLGHKATPKGVSMVGIGNGMG